MDSPNQTRNDLLGLVRGWMVSVKEKRARAAKLHAEADAIELCVNDLDLRVSDLVFADDTPRGVVDR